MVVFSGWKSRNRIQRQIHYCANLLHNTSVALLLCLNPGPNSYRFSSVRRNTLWLSPASVDGRFMFLRVDALHGKRYGVVKGVNDMNHQPSHVTSNPLLRRL